MSELLAADIFEVTTPTELYAVLFLKLSYKEAGRPALDRPITCITAAMIHKPVVIITGASK